MELYLISDGTYLKIGVSMNTQNRLAQLQTSCPNRLVILRSIWLGFAARQIEKALHARYQDFRLEGEWFHLDAIAKIELAKDFDSLDAASRIFYGPVFEGARYPNPFTWLNCLN